MHVHKSTEVMFSMNMFLEL